MLRSALVQLNQRAAFASPRSTRYFAAVVGASLGIGAGLASGVTAPIELGALAATLAIVAVARVFDVEERRIPNRLTYPSIGSALLIAAFVGAGLTSVAGIAAAGGFMLLAAVVGGISRGWVTLN